MKDFGGLPIPAALPCACTALVAVVARGPAVFVKSEKFFSDPDAAIEQAGDKRRMFGGGQ